MSQPATQTTQTTPTNPADTPAGLAQGINRMTVQEATSALLQERSPPATPARTRANPLPAEDRSPEREPDDDDRPYAPEIDTPLERGTEPEPAGEEAGAAEAERQADAQREGTEDPEYEIKVGDKPERVRLSELQQGYLRQQDYSRKTGELASQRQAFGQETSAVREERAAYAVLLKSLKSQVENGGQPAIDWDALRRVDPVGFLEQKELARDRQAKLDAIASEEVRLADTRAREQQQLIQEVQAEAKRILLDRIPEWRKPGVAKAEIETMMKVAMEHYGYQQAELDRIIDPRFVLLARDALRYRQTRGQTVAGKRVAPQPGRPVPAKRSVPQSDPNISRKQAAQAQFNRRPSLNNAVDALIAERGED